MPFLVAPYTSPQYFDMMQIVFGGMFMSRNICWYDRICYTYFYSYDIHTTPKKNGYAWYDFGATSRSHTVVTPLCFFLPPQCCLGMMLRFFDDGMTLIICLNRMYLSLMLQKTAAAEQLDDINGSRKEKGNKTKGNMKSGTIEQEKK